MTNRLKINHFYKSKQYCLLVYPTKEKLVEAIATKAYLISFDSPRHDYSEYWSKNLNCKVGYSELNSAFFVIELSKIKNIRCSKVLFENIAGWIILKDWMKFVAVG